MERRRHRRDRRTGRVAESDHLTTVQVEVARIVFGLKASGGYLVAGGAALLASDLIARPTEDLDLFASRPITSVIEAKNARALKCVHVRLRSVEILRSALKHGVSPADIAYAISGAWQRTRVGEDPDRWLYVGVDGAARPLEIVTVQGDDGAEVVIHAMKLRRKYYPEGGRP